MTGGSTLRGAGWSAIALVAAAAAILGFAGGWAWQASGFGRGSTEQVVRNYILENPEVLPEAMQRLQDRELARRIEPLRSTLQLPYPGATLGNKDGSVVLVEFADYNCPYCKMSVQDVERLIAGNPDLKVVLRQDPVLSEESLVAARMALAAADQGKFPAFHKAMYAKDSLTQDTIDDAAREAGVDLAQAKADIGSGKYESELNKNRRLAETIGFSGTPSWVIGKRAFSGAVGHDRLKDAIGEAQQAAGNS